MTDREQLREFLFNNDNILDEGLFKKVGGAVKSTIAAPARIAGSVVKGAGQAVAAPVKAVGTTVGTAAKTAKNIVTLSPKKLVKDIGTGAKKMGQHVTKPVTTVAKGTGKALAKPIQKLTQGATPEERKQSLRDWVEDKVTSIEEESQEARELSLYIINDSQLYRQRALPIIKNMRRKIDKGIYNERLAIKQWMYLVDDGAKKYIKEHGSPGDNWNVIFPKRVRLEVAEILLDHYDEQVRESHFDFDKYIDEMDTDESIWSGGKLIAKRAAPKLAGKLRWSSKLKKLVRVGAPI